jgi:hypothetical protein
MTTTMTPAEEAARLLKFSNDVHAAIYELATNMAMDCGKTAAEIVAIGAKIANVATDAAIEELNATA